MNISDIQQRIESIDADIAGVMTTGQLLEHLLDERVGARGKGIHEKLTSVSSAIPELVSQIRYLSSIRNSFAHDVNPTIRDPQRFVKTAQDVLSDLNARPIASRDTQESNDAVIDTNALYSEFDVPTSSDIKLISGTVSSCRPIGQAVQLTLQGVALSIELSVQQKSSIAIGDRVSLAGYRQRSVGTFHALAYRNFHRDVYGWNELPDDSVVTQRQIERERFEKSFRFPIGNVVAWVAKFIAGICLIFAGLSAFSRNGDSPILWLFVGGFFALFGGFAHKVMRELGSGFPQHDWDGEWRNHNNWRSMYERARWLVQN